MGDVVVGQKGTVDVYLNDGRRQRFDLKDVPAAGRDALGSRIVKFKKGHAVTRLVLL